MGIHLVVERRYLEGGREKVEQVTWEHLPDVLPGVRLVPRRFRKPKFVAVKSSERPDPRGRPLPGWCAPDYPPNRWLWVQAAQPAADLSTVIPSAVGSDGSAVHGPGSAYWSYYDLPLRDGVVLL